MSIDTNRHHMSRRKGAAGVGSALLLTLTLSGCDFDVVNPGPVEDAFLDNRTAHEAMANGVQVQLADALTNVAYTTGAVTREIFPAGSTGSFGITGAQQIGIIRYDDTHVSWTAHQRARQMATQFMTRFEENENVDVQGYEPAVRIALWGGYANRLLGDAFCTAVRDGGAPEPRTVFWEDAEDWFTRTISLAGGGFPDVVMAAYAGRASVRANLGDWTGAMADAAQVDDDFSWEMPYTTQESSQHNRIYYAGANQPYRAHTVWNTPYEQYYLDTDDPRTPWGQNPDIPLGDAGLAMLDNGRATWYFQLKHDRRESPHELSSGWEMRLLEAENRLHDGLFDATTLELINRHRVELGLDPWTPTLGSEQEFWEVYMRERGIELWLNARRMIDLHRWKEAGISDEWLHPLERPGHPDSYLSADRTLAYPIPQNEYETNQNLGAVVSVCPS